MALNKEIWINAIVGNLFADNTFAARSVNHSSFVNNKTVHVPNAGSAPTVTKNRAEFPASVSTRSDVDLTYSIDEYTTAPYRVPNAEEVELSYNKRESIISASRAALQETIHTELIKSWVPSSFNKVMTSGTSTAAHTASSTGNRSKITINDVLKVKIEFDKVNIPAQGRCFLLDYAMYNDLLASLTSNEYHAFLASANAQTGVVGSLYGFDFYMRSTVLRVNAAGTALSSGSTASDSAAGIAWQQDCVARALGETNIFDDAQNPLYYGDVFSALVRAGGHYTRNDKSGVCLICETTPQG